MFLSNAKHVRAPAGRTGNAPNGVADLFNAIFTDIDIFDFVPTEM